ncbi:MAG TPA: TrkA C-terminal domain-containing protein [Actinomycetota bacterium]|jgi:uncharacterized protein with PhoU and TrkA domain
MADDERPKNVKELLVEAKDASELMVDLAYAAVFFNEDDLAEEVEELEERMDGYLRRLREVAMLAARSPEDAEQMAGVLHIAAAIEKIGDAASDIARVVQANLGIPDELRPDLRHADEVTGRVRVRDGAEAVGQSLRELMLPSEIGVWILAVRRGADWEFGPGPDTIVSGGDVLVFQGPEEAANLLRKIVGAPALPVAPERESPALTDLDRAVDILVEMKNSAEVAVGLAYSSLLFNDPALAAEVGTLEARSDILHDELESWVLRSAPEARKPDELRGILRLANAGETIFDAARDMTWSVEHGEELHPVVAMALEETDEIASEVVIEPGSPADGHSLKELTVETETGMFVLAVQRGRRWVYRPRAGFVLQGGDRVISVGPEEGASELQAMATAPARAFTAGH